MTALVLDTRALEVITHPKTDTRAAEHMKGLLKTAGRIGIPVYVPTAVLAEAYRGTPADAAIDRVLSKGINPITTGKATAKIAAGLKHRDHLDSCHIVDALVIATSIRLGGGLVATGDPDDLRSLARQHSNIDVRSLP
jgi:predicted nucleic acid-binding protein